MADPYETFAANLARLRTERGLTQEQLALEAGMTLSEISRIESRRREPKVRTIAKIAAALNVEPGALFAGTGDLG